MGPSRRIPLSDYPEVPPAEMAKRADAFFDDLKRRRSVREFASRPVDRAVIEQCLRAASTAPSGANQQPWHFVAVSDPRIKQQIRQAAEKEEYEFYRKRATKEWLDALASLGTDWRKPFLEEAPWLIAIFEERSGRGPDGEKVQHYYSTESVGIATGFLIAAVHHAGLACLTHTPSPMGFLREILGRPENERPFLLLVVGYPADGATVPEIARKPFEAIGSFV